MDFAKDFKIAISFDVNNDVLKESSEQLKELQGSLDKTLDKQKKSNNEALNSFTVFSDGIKKAFQAVTVATGVAGVAINNLLDGASGRYVEFSNVMGDSFESLNQFVRAGDISIRTNGQAVANELMSLKQQIDEMKIFGGVPVELQMLNVDVNQSFDKITEDIAGKLNSLEANVGLTMANKTGLSEFYKSLSSLDLSNETRIIEPISASDVKTLQDATESLNVLKTVFKDIKDRVAVDLAPVLNDTLKNFFTWIKQNQEGIVYLFKTTVTVLVDMAGAFLKIVNFGASLIKTFLSSKEAVMGLTIAVSALFIAFAPSKLSRFTLMGVALTAFIAVVEDVVTFFQGGESVTADIVNWLSSFEPIKIFFAGLTTILSKAFDAIKTVGSILSKGFFQYQEDLNLSNNSESNINHKLIQDESLINEESRNKAQQFFNNNNQEKNINMNSTFNITGTDKNITREIEGAIKRALQGAV